MKKKIIIIFIIFFLILLTLITFVLCKMNTHDYNEISSTFYEQILENYLGNNDEEVLITSKSFINLSSQERLSYELVEKILNDVKYKNIELINEDEIKLEQKNITFKFSSYDINLVKFSINTYYGKNLKEIRNYNGKYENNSWKLELLSLSSLD